MDVMKITELVQEIAGLVDSPRDLFTNAAVTPHLYRCIDIPLDSVECVAMAFKNRPELAAACRSLSFCRPSYEAQVVSDNLGTDDSQDPSRTRDLSESLVTIFAAIARNGKLEFLRWKWDTREYRGRSVCFSADIWTSISRASVNLQELDVSIQSSEEHWFRSITDTPFCNLRILRIRMKDAHGWDCENLKKVLDTLYDLEELSLHLPLCCGPRGLTFHSTHPRLRRFSFSSSFLIPEVDFLARHPGLECLYLDTEQPFAFSPLNQLRVLSVDQSTLLRLPTAVSSHTQLTHLRLRRMPHLSVPMVGEAVRAVARTLRCLELDEIDRRANFILLKHIVPLLSSAPALEELGILGLSSYPPPPNWTAKKLCKFLAVFDRTVPLVALRFGDHFKTGELLPPALLNNFGRLPPRLKYIGWDVTPRPMVYVIERRAKKNVGSAVERPVGGDWASESILQYMVHRAA
ncbi:hypothetical protein B0H19DRAFT_1148122 [Mycena capillaripes]|nr:hypothetical protein B0H19DRAFT_1148122 [Mycena capillaripes]